jgi:hypothetical protein
MKTNSKNILNKRSDCLTYSELLSGLKSYRYVRLRRYFDFDSYYLNSRTIIKKVAIRCLSNPHDYSNIVEFEPINFMKYLNNKKPFVTSL